MTCRPISSERRTKRAVEVRKIKSQSNKILLRPLSGELSFVHNSTRVRSSFTSSFAMVGAVSCGFAVSAVARPTAAARRAAPCTHGVLRVSPSAVKPSVSVPGVTARSGGPIALSRRSPVRARNVVTSDGKSSKGPLDTVEIENCLQVREPSRALGEKR